MRPTLRFLAPRSRTASVLALALLTFVQVARARPHDRAKPEAQARAESGEEPDAAARARAEQHLHAGTVAFDNGDYALAITELKASLAEAPNPSLFYALGQAYRMSGDCPQAADWYRKFLESHPSDKQRDAANANIERCESKSAAPPPASRPQHAEAPREKPPEVQPRPASRAPAAATAPADRKSWYEDVPGDLLAGTGIAAAAVGTALFFVGRGKVSDADGARDDQSWVAGRGDASGGLTEQRVGLVVMGVGGALVAGGIVRYLTLGGSKEPTAVRIGPTFGGMIATGAF